MGCLQRKVVRKSSARKEYILRTICLLFPYMVMTGRFRDNCRESSRRMISSRLPISFPIFLPVQSPQVLCSFNHLKSEHCLGQDLCGQYASQHEDSEEPQLTGWKPAIRQSLLLCVSFLTSWVYSQPNCSHLTTPSLYTRLLYPQSCWSTWWCLGGLNLSK